MLRKLAKQRFAVNNHDQSGCVDGVGGMRRQKGFFSCGAIIGGCLMVQTVQRREKAMVFLRSSSRGLGDDCSPVKHVFFFFFNTFDRHPFRQQGRFVETCFANRTLPVRLGGLTLLVAVCL